MKGISLVSVNSTNGNMMRTRTGICFKSKPKIKAARLRNIATLATLTSRHFLSMASLISLHHAATIALVLLSAHLSPTTSAFSPPVPARKSLGATTAIYKYNGIRIGSQQVVVGSRNDPSSLYASEEDDNERSESSKLNEDNDDDDDDEEEDDEVDIITQRLRRNADNGPINPIKEHDKMIQENEAEASSAKDNLGNNGTTINAGPDAAASSLYSYMLATAVSPDFDPDVSTDEAYVESQFKELLSRKGEDLSSLGPGIATLPLDPSSNEAKSENELAKMEAELQRVMNEARASGNEAHDESNLEASSKKQSDMLERAHKLQSEIDQRHVDDCGSVLLANLGFYEAFSLQDPEGMKDVWWQSPSVMCIHPSHPPLIGSNAVFDSFSTMFDNGIKGRVRSGGDGNKAARGGVFMTPTNIRGFSVRGTTASLVCDEEVYSKGSAGESIGRIGGELVNKLLTTNVFRKIGGKWKMTNRHASWHPESMAAQEAMKAEPGIVLYDEKEDAKKSDASSNSMACRLKRAKKEGMTLRKLNGEGTSKRPSGLPSIPSSLEGLDANAVLGIPMPKEEEENKSKPSSDADGMIGKIINLSDLLGGSSDSSSSGGGGDKDDDLDKGIGDALADMLMGGSTDSDSTSTTGSGTPDDPFVTRRIIKIGPEDISNLGKKNKKGSSDDEEDVVIDLRGKSEEEKKATIAKFAGDVAAEHAKTEEEDGEDGHQTRAQAMAKLVGKFKADDAEMEYEDEAPTTKVSLRQKCIATLRKLSDDGLLSSNQKRVLLTDIITSSARGESSMVEVAYDLLCTGDAASEGGDSSDLDTGMEDFTEQCRVFASMGEE